MALTTNILAYWKLDESSGNAADSVGSATGVNSNVTYAAGFFNNGAVFNGTNAGLDTGTSVDLQGNFSIAFWAKGTPGTGKVLISKEKAGTNFPQFNIHADASAHVVLDVYGDNNPTPTAQAVSISSITSTFKHFVVTRDGTNIKIYCNGALEATIAWSTAQWASPDRLAIGAASTGSSAFTSFYTGTLDEIGIWSRALTLAEAGELYRNGLGLPYPFLLIAVSETLALTDSFFTGYAVMVSDSLSGILDAIKTKIGWSNTNKSSAPTWINTDKN